ncbi:venom serine protease 34-like [Panulirus ornatus]|uniref:venom serine protease 34-like n=1 Tax=Panulirus ornatus TaxID=150431 RepID=UPI003A8969E6
MSATSPHPRSSKMHLAVLALAVSILSVWSNTEARIISVKTPYVKKALAPPSFLAALRQPNRVVQAGDSERNIRPQSRADDSADGNTKPQPREDESDGNTKPQPREDESDGNTKPQPREDESDGNTKPQPREDELDGNTKPQPRDDESDGNTKPQPRENELDGNTKPQPRDDESHMHIMPRQEADECMTYTVSPGESYVFTSEDYPDKYPNGEKCIRKFKADPEATFTVMCPEFDLRNSAGCTDDFLRINFKDGEKNRFCGNSFTTQIGTTKVLTVKFKTDDMKRGLGFNCTVSVARPAGQCECGKVNRATRIVGGVKTEVHEYPWHVGLVSAPGTAPFCGASIINSMWIMTAAHCVAGLGPGDLKAVVGDHKWSSGSETSVTKTLTVEEVIINNKYDEDTFNNDIALLKLRKTISFNRNNKIAPVCLPSASESYKNVNAIVSGWGVLAEDGDQPKQLYEVTVPTMTNGKCKEKYGAAAVTANMICAGLDEGGKDACQGDSGGALVTPGGSTPARMVQIGIVSWGSGCAQPNLPGVYTRVSRYLDWITALTGGSTSCITP